MNFTVFSYFPSDSLLRSLTFKLFSLTFRQTLFCVLLLRNCCLLLSVRLSAVFSHIKTVVSYFPSGSLLCSLTLKLCSLTFRQTLYCFHLLFFFAHTTSTRAVAARGGRLARPGGLIVAHVLRRALGTVVVHSVVGVNGRGERPRGKSRRERRDEGVPSAPFFPGVGPPSPPSPAETET